MERLRFGLYCPGCMPGYHLPYFAARELGVFAAHGLDVEIVDALPGTENIHAVSRGERDACLTSTLYLLRSHGEDPSLAARFVFMVARRPHMSAFVVSDRIESFADLDGASLVGSLDDSFGREYVALLDDLGLHAGPALDLPYGRWLRALADGKADVALDFLELLPRFERAAARRGVEVHALSFAAAGRAGYGSGVVVSQRLIDERPDAVRALGAAIADALELTRREPERAVDAMRTRFRGIDTELTVRGWRAGEPLYFGNGVPGGMDDETWRLTVEQYAATHGTPRVPVARLYDAAFARESRVAARA